MADKYSGNFDDPQTMTIVGEAKERGRGRVFKSDQKKKDEEKKPTSAKVSDLYNKGVALLKSRGFTLELAEGSDHCNHRILRPAPPQQVKGIRYPHSFQPLQDISSDADFEGIESAFHPDLCDPDVRHFWEPLFHPKAGDSDLLSFTDRLLKMRKISATKNIHQVLDYGHTFDPAGRLGGQPVSSPRIWVPDRDWFDPALHAVTFADVFTIFPEAEQEMLRLILGRVGVGRSNHLPPGMQNPVDHTARMAGVIVGKDAGLGKSTLFNGMTAAFQQCGFITHTFKRTDDRFGMKKAATSDIAYKDDTAMKELKAFLGAEETKILITGGLFQTEDKFLHAEELWPKCVILVNSNDWNSKFAYDLDPGIIDRIKLISTYREYEVAKNRDHLEGMVSDGSPDLRPRAHMPYLANKLGVAVESLYLWCLRLATDRFWEVVNDTKDPAINRLQVEVRYWTTRQRIRFKADVTQALINALTFSWMLRTGDQFLPELTPGILLECLDHFYFVGVDPSGLNLMTKMKKHWEAAGRPSTHYYQGFREIRWESVRKAITAYTQRGDSGDNTSAEVIKNTMEKLVMRDGFQIGGSMSYVVENWENTRHATEELAIETQRFLLDVGGEDKRRLLDLNITCQDKWLLENKHYSPDRAERFRSEARKKLYDQASSAGVKP